MSPLPRLATATVNPVSVEDSADFPRLFPNCVQGHYSIDGTAFLGAHVKPALNCAIAVWATVGTAHESAGVLVA
jgi:hypothetical protein